MPKKWEGMDKEIRNRGGRRFVWAEGARAIGSIGQMAISHARKVGSIFKKEKETDLPQGEGLRKNIVFWRSTGATRKTARAFGIAGTKRRDLMRTARPSRMGD